jgi:hypothetical protein
MVVRKGTGTYALRGMFINKRKQGTVHYKRAGRAARSPYTRHTITLRTCIREVLCSNPSWNTDYTDRFFVAFPSPTGTCRDNASIRLLLPSSLVYGSSYFHAQGITLELEASKTTICIDFSFLFGCLQTYCYGSRHTWRSFVYLYFAQKVKPLSRDFWQRSDIHSKESAHCLSHAMRR